jgi:hypothetical protein
MCAGCKSFQSKDFDDKQFGTLRDGSMGHGGIAIKESTKFTGDGEVTTKFGEKLDPNVKEA